MSVQENVLQRGSSLTYPSTKPIASKTHMEVQVHNSTTDVWDVVSVDDYDLITNSCVFNIDYDLSPYDMVNVRVGDTPNDLALQPSYLSTIYAIADEIVIVANVEDDVVTVAGISDEVVATAGIETQIRDVTSEPLRQSILDAESNANRAEDGATESETSAGEAVDSAGIALAESLNADSWANEMVDTDVLFHEWDSVNNVMFPPVPLVGMRSALHWMEQAKIVASGLDYQSLWSMDAVCTLPPNGTDSGEFYVIDAIDPLCLTYAVGDWLVWSGTAWDKVSWNYSWGSVTDVTVDGLPAQNGQDLATTVYVDALLLSMNPIGTVVFRMDAINPATIYGGTWALIAGDASLSFGDGTVRDGVASGENDPVVPLAEHSHTLSELGEYIGQLPSGGTNSYIGNENTRTTSSAGTAGATLNVRGARISINVWERLS